MQLEPNLLCQSDAQVLAERVTPGTIGLVYLDPPWMPLGEQMFEGDRSEKHMHEHVIQVSKVLQLASRLLTDKGNLLFYSTPLLAGTYRLILDQIFGRWSFRQEIIVPRASYARGKGPTHDAIYHYAKSDEFTFHQQYRQFTREEIDHRFRQVDERGPFRLVDLTHAISRAALQFAWRGYRPPPGRSWRISTDRLESLASEGKIHFSDPGPPRQKVYLQDAPGLEIGTIWDDISPIAAKEKYPTQQPISLVERVIQMSSNPGEVIFDPYVGSGTSILAASKNDRRWIGGDISKTAIEIAGERLKREGLAEGRDFRRISESELRDEFPRLDLNYVAVSTGFEELLQQRSPQFVLNEPVDIEETRHYEFKEITSQRPLDTIKNTADEYAVAYLNSDGGRIFWGIRDVDRVTVGITLVPKDRNELRRVVTEKLSGIQPALDPTQYKINIHDVVSGGETVKDLVVVELVVPRVAADEPYFTASGEMFVRLDAVKKQLKGPQITDWIRRRLAP